MEKLLKDRCRIIVIGASESGKTFLIYTMIMKGMFGNKDKIIIMAKNKQTFEQDLYKELKRKKGVIFKEDPKGKSMPTFLSEKDGKILLILDDYDSFYPWTEDLFSVVSHHSDISVIVISHGYKTGNKKIRTSTEYIILTNSPDNDLFSFVDDIFHKHQDKAEITRIIKSTIESKTYERKDGLKKIVGNVLINRNKTLDSSGNDIGLLFTIPIELTKNIIKLY